MFGLNKLSTAMAGIGLAFLPAIFIPVHAAPPVQLAVQILDPLGACVSWTTGGTLLAPTITCDGPAASPVAGAPTGCVGTVTPGTSVPALGGNVTLGVTGCTPGTAVLKTWQTNLGGATITGSTLTVPGYGGTSARTVVATNQACLADDATKCAPVTAQTTQLAPVGTGGGTGGDIIKCAGFDNTYFREQPWASTTNLTRIQTTGFGSTTAVVIRYKVPSNVTSTGAGRIQGIEYGGGGTYRRATLTVSDKPCDFSGQAGVAPYNVAPAGSSFTFWITVGGSQQGTNVLLQPGGTYYLNIRNQDSFGYPTCVGSSCEMFISFTKPSGT